MLLNRRENIIAAVFSFVFSQTIVAGYGVHYVEIRSSYAENYISYGMRSFVLGILISLVIFPLVLALFRLQAKVVLRCSEKPSKKIFFLFWIIIFALWLPYLLAFYPGGIVGDGIEVLKMALAGGIPRSNHWTFLYIYTVRIVLKIGSLFFSDINDCVFLYAFLESVFVSGVCAKVSYEVYYNFSKIIAFLSVMMYGLCGFFASYGMTFWADGVFGTLLVLLCIFLWKRSEECGIGKCLQFGILTLLICQWRNNGLYIIVLVLAGMLLVMKKKALRFIALGSAAVIVTLIINGPVYDKLGVHKDSAAESMAIPMQQMAAVVNSDYELSKDQKAVLYSFAPEEVWKEKYCPTLCDDLKFSADQSYLSRHSSDFLKVWIELLPHNFGTYVRAYLMQTIGFWKLNSFQGNYWDYWIGVADNEIGVKPKDLLYELSGKTFSGFLAGRMRFISSGTMVWLLLFSFCSMLYQGVNKERILVLLPLIGCWITIMLAAPIAFAYRYVFALAIGAPIIILLPFCKKRS